jgi:cobalt-zinc-cadmium efflux system membrane fusion protein
MKQLLTILSIAVALITFLSCGSKKSADAGSEVQEKLITVTRQQFETNKMELGEPLNKTFEEVVRCNGSIVVQPSGVARISTSIPGLVERINCKTGQKVNAGQVLFELTGNDFVELQKDFAETSSQLKRIKSEYERIRSLYNENVVSEKDFIMAESEFKVANAKYSALKIKIRFIGLDDAKIENGSFYDFFSIRSPINGHISEINVSLGQYADQQTNMAEILDMNKLQLKIAVFEKDLSKLNEDQKVSFTLLGNRSEANTATLKSIGKNVDEESKSIMCFAEIDELSGDNFVNNAYVEATIITDTDTATAVPEESILKSGDDAYLLSLVKNENDNYFLKRIRVDLGRIENGYIELVNNPGVKKILTKGVYNIPVE